MYKEIYIYRERERVWSHVCKNKHVYICVDADKEKNLKEYTPTCFHFFDKCVLF